MISKVFQHSSRKTTTVKKEVSMILLPNILENLPSARCFAALMSFLSEGQAEAKVLRIDKRTQTSQSPNNLMILRQECIPLQAYHLRSS